nr:MAG TPA: Transcriptional regulator [Caudoviricetes sp.]
MTRPFGGIFRPRTGKQRQKTKMEASETKETKTLQDICREAKNEQHLTYANIAEKSGIVEKTVQNFFSSSSKLPPVYTAGPICRALGVSIDKYFEIVSNDQPGALEIERQEKEHLAEMGEMKDAQIERSDRSMRQKDRIMIAMAGFILFLIAYMTIVDLLDPMIGLFHGKFSAAGAVALLGFTIAAVSFVVIGFANIKNRKK